MNQALFRELATEKAELPAGYRRGGDAEAVRSVKGESWPCAEVVSLALTFTVLVPLFHVS